MENLVDLREAINIALDNRYWKSPNSPKRCVLNKFWELGNVHGSFVEIYDRENEKDLLFIADEPNEDYFHSGTDVFKTDCFKHRCLWVFENEVTVRPVGGFYI